MSYINFYHSATDAFRASYGSKSVMNVKNEIICAAIT